MLTPLPAAVALALCALGSLVRDFRLGVRIGVFLYPAAVALIDRELSHFLVAIGLLGIVGGRFAMAALEERRGPGG